MRKNKIGDHASVQNRHLLPTGKGKCLNGTEIKFPPVDSGTFAYPFTVLLPLPPGL